jgi:hypothetical protein
VLHIKAQEAAYEFAIEDLSSNGTFVNGIRVNKKDRKAVGDQDNICLMCPKSVSAEEAIAFILIITSRKRRRASPEPVATKKVKATDASMLQDLTCVVCLEVMHQPISLIPCLHAVSYSQFCGGCMAEWLEKSKLCPTCNQSMTEIQPNTSMTNIINVFLKENPEHQREAAEIAKLDTVNTLKQGRVIKPDRPQPEENKRALPPMPQLPQVQLPVVQNPHARQVRFQAQYVAPPPAPRYALPNAFFPQQYRPFGGGFYNFGQFNHQATSCLDCIRLGGYYQACGFVHVKCHTCTIDIPLKFGVNSCMVCHHYFCNVAYPQSICQTIGVSLTQVHLIGHYSATIFTAIPHDALKSNAYERGVLEEHLRVRRLSFEAVLGTLFSGQTLELSSF